MMKFRRVSPRRITAHALCVATVSGLALCAVPAVVAAGPAVVAAPVVPQTVIGLAEGAQGADVKAVQTALLAAGVPVPGGADGVFGPATRSAVTAFQSRNGIAASGSVDEPTATALGLATAPAAASGSSGLTVGATGDAVKELQTALMNSGVFVPGGVDGFYGPATKTAVSNYQRWNGLPVTGEVDAKMASKLKLGSGGIAPAPAAAATPSTGQAYVGMTTGARGDNVKALQRALIAAGVSIRGGADGVFGPLTAAALTTYQQANGLTANGVLDAAAVAKLGLGAAAPATPAATPTPAPSAATGYVGLTVGSQGAAVKDLQRALMNTGLTLLGGADGVFGNATKSTLILFQRVNGLPQTGVVSAKDASLMALGTTATPQGIGGQAGYAVFGERGDRVKALQQSLLKAGISFNGGADGIFGASTAGAILEFQRREGLPVTGKIDAATAGRLAVAVAPAPAAPSAAGVSIDVFPVQGQCWFGDTWAAPRSGARTHEGVDIIAAKGKLLYAAVTGTVSKMYYDYPGALSGNGLRVAQDNGTYFTYLHMDTFAEGIGVGTKVTAGQVIGTVGATGNAATPHLHFEAHPNGGAAVNPYPMIKAVDACSMTAPRG